jgi:hypothetical protein
MRAKMIDIRMIPRYLLHISVLRTLIRGTMKSIRSILVATMLCASGCSKQEGHHPWVEPGMSQAEVLALVGSPIRTDSIYHQYELVLGSLSWESLDSIRRSLGPDEGNRMSLGRPVDHSSRSDQYISWYYGPLVVDTTFTFERSGTEADSLTKLWFQVKKQRAVVFDVRSMAVKERGFSVVDVTQIH